ncbi:FliM/FliN family flagellar motor switch protein [Endozoicomonas ascidiicola]|uniref:FliM/FliN family flagellar motor switch protein n=1 Tax=Endozoicomonas ascidiicola TaxID=1698521 RepID=UPI000829844A|nr:FliM/FliN family flagellar motor switch protein [Endozoicomonas ascidiicola]
MRPFDLIQGRNNAASQSESLTGLFESMGSKCTEALASTIKKEWGEAICLEQRPPSEETLEQPVIADDQFITHHFTVAEHAQARLFIHRLIPTILVDIACGGNGEVSIARPSLTISEKHLLGKLVRFITAQLQRSLEEVTENSGLEFLALSGNEAISKSEQEPIELFHTLTLSIGTNTVDIHFVMSRESFALLQEDDTDHFVSSVDPEELNTALHTVPVSLTATLCEYTTRLRNIQQLKPGDFIPIRMSSVANIHSAGRHLFNAQVVKMNDQLCLQVMGCNDRASNFTTEL